MHVLGDPDMSEETAKALLNMAKAVQKQLGEKSPKDGEETDGNADL